MMTSCALPTVAQLKLVYVYYMRAAADNVVMYNYDFSTALVVATQTIAPEAFASRNAVSAIPPSSNWAWGAAVTARDLGLSPFSVAIPCAFP